MEDLLLFFSSNLVILFLVFITTILILWKKTSQISSNQKPPQPPKLPIIGNLHQLHGPLPHRALAELAKIYGPFMQLQLGQVSAVVVSSAQVAKQVMKDNDIKVSDRSRVSVADILLYKRQDVVFAPYGDFWRQMRKICILELFSWKRVQSFRTIREEEITHFVKSIDSKVGSEINLSEMIFSLTYSIVVRTVIGRKNNENQEAILHVIGRLMKALRGFTVVDLFPSLKFIHVITGFKSSLLKLHKEADQLMEHIIKEHKQKLKLEDEEANNNLLNVLLKLQENSDSPLTTDGIKAITLNMFGGGTHSSATILEWAMSELMKNPRIMKKAQEEVRKVFIENGKLDESAIDELKFLKAIVKETMRLHPPGPLVSRLCREECVINGHKIKPKTEVFVNLWAIGRDPNHWTEPENFNPERFIESEVDYKGCDFEYIPFGAGRRICPGIQLGIANLELALAKTLCHFNWKLPTQMNPHDFDMTETFALSVKRKNPLRLIPIALDQYPIIAD